MTDEARIALVNRHVAAIAEHFANVQIHVSWQEESATRCLSLGSGDWYARQGMAHEFIRRDAAQDSAEAFKNLVEDEDDL